MCQLYLYYTACCSPQVLCISHGSATVYTHKIVSITVPTARNCAYPTSAFQLFFHFTFSLSLSIFWKHRLTCDCVNNHNTKSASDIYLLNNKLFHPDVTFNSSRLTGHQYHKTCSLKQCLRKTQHSSFCLTRYHINKYEKSPLKTCKSQT